VRSEKGQSMVEFALVVPLLIVLLFGIVDISRLFHASLTIDHCRKGSCPGSECSAERYGSDTVQQS
jgi:hypothetical protein